MKKVEKIVKDIFNIKEIEDIEFKKIYGLYLAFKTKYIFIHDEISSAEMFPLAIIYKENDDYYLAPLDESEKIKDITEKFVEKCL